MKSAQQKRKAENEAIMAKYKVPRKVAEKYRMRAKKDGCSVEQLWDRDHTVKTSIFTQAFDDTTEELCEQLGITTQLLTIGAIEVIQKVQANGIYVTNNHVPERDRVPLEQFVANNKNLRQFKDEASFLYVIVDITRFCPEFGI